MIEERLRACTSQPVAIMLTCVRTPSFSSLVMKPAFRVVITLISRSNRILQPSQRVQQRLLPIPKRQENSLLSGVHAWRIGIPFPEWAGIKLLQRALRAQVVRRDLG